MRTTCMSPRALPQVSRGRLILDGCVESRVILESRAVQIVHWHCLHDGEALRSERCHTHHVLTVCDDGCCQLVDGRTRVVVDTATAVLHRPGATYRTLHPRGCNDSGISIAFRDDIAEEALARHKRARRSDAPMATVTARPMRLAMQQLVMTWRRRGGLDVDTIAMEELAVEMLAAAAADGRESSASRAQTGLDHRRIVDDTREYLGVHFRESIRLETIAHDVGSSPFHLSRIFKEITGSTIRGYLQRLRLCAAVHRLLETREPLAQIALESGFAHQSHLTDVCTRQTGLAPAAIRRAAVG